MYANPQLYDRSNYLQVRDGAKLIGQMKSEFASKTIGTILDIGCGSGNLTEMMYRELKPKRIVAFDLAADMIAFARERSQAKGIPDDEESGITYKQADACDSFQDLSEKLQLTPSSVDVIISFYCIHWVPNKRQTCENMFKFLKPNGKFYLIISVWNELFPVQHQIVKHSYWRPLLLNWLKEKMPQGETESKEVDESQLANFDTENRPNYDSLHKFWHNYLLNAAMVMEEMHLIYTDYPFKKVQDFNDQVEAVCYWLTFVPLEKHAHFLADYFALIQRDYVSKQISIQKKRRRSLNILEPAQLSGAPGSSQQLLPTMTGEQEAVTMFRFDYIYATIVGRKPSTAL